MDRPATPNSGLDRDRVVVCVDDEPAILSSLRRLLRNEPYLFLTTQNPDEAMNWILQKHVSIVIADQRMPGMTGLEFLDLVKICSPSTFRVMLTGQSDLTGILKLEKIDSIQKMLRKPWDGDEFKRIVRELLLSDPAQGDALRSSRVTE
jgi:response regulator RpfG family c-di-GMP phosphodiesterase